MSTEDLTPTHAETRAARRTRSSLPPDVVRAARSPLLWTLGSVGAMRHFGLRHPDYKLAQRVAMATRAGDVARAMQEREVAQLKAKVVRAEVRYPLIHRRLVTASESASEVARGYVGGGGRATGHGGEPLTRMRACQIRRQFDEYVEAVATVSDRERVLRDIEAMAAAHDEGAAVR